ncbi:hypothetical protein DVH24_011181 [Malus domestica]|uniref:Uncharacterized protein n=1 Tax=Malus domestica TaxID=3750 RepID=A0A498JUW2_MALDO|nr:hypothetical protein DVH24_011181 [Malus domestica]
MNSIKIDFLLNPPPPFFLCNSPPQPQQQNPPPLSLPCPRGNSLPHSLTHFFSSTPATPNSLITIPVFATLSSPLENPPLAQDGPNGSTRKPISLSSGMYQSPVTIALLKIFERFFLDPPKDAPSHNRTKILYSAFVGVSKTSLMVRREPQQTPVGVARNSSDSGRVRSFVVPSACSGLQTPVGVADSADQT